MQASREDLSLVLGEVAIFRGLSAAVTAEVTPGSIPARALAMSSAVQSVAVPFLAALALSAIALFSSS